MWVWMSWFTVVVLVDKTVEDVFVESTLKTADIHCILGEIQECRVSSSNCIEWDIGDNTITTTSQLECSEWWVLENSMMIWLQWKQHEDAINESWCCCQCWWWLVCIQLRGCRWNSENLCMKYEFLSDVSLYKSVVYILVNTEIGYDSISISDTVLSVNVTCSLTNSECVSDKFCKACNLFTDLCELTCDLRYIQIW